VRIIAIAIVAANGVIGDGSRQPFEFAEDWARYKRVTKGHPMIMGRRTFEAIGRWLPERATIVVTSRPDLIEPPPPESSASGYAVRSLDEAIDIARSLDDEEIYIAGGGVLYRAAWSLLTDLDITEVHAEAEGSVCFPEIDSEEWVEARREPRGPFDFVGYRRR
jgi:dihydrofolate reductase